MAEELSPIQIQIKGLDEFQARLKDVPRGMARALPDAIRRALISGRQVASDAVRARYMAKAGWVKASLGNPVVIGMTGLMTSKSTKAPLAMFPHTDRWPSGVSVKELRAGDRMLIRHAFVPSSIGKVMVRAGGRRSARYPLKEMVGLSVPEMLENPNEVEPVVAAAIEEMLYKRLNSNIERILSGAWRI